VNKYNIRNKFIKNIILTIYNIYIIEFLNLSNVYLFKGFKEELKIVFDELVLLYLLKYKILSFSKSL
jgi:hypothetical protein